jgi:hypothetical protein
MMRASIMTDHGDLSVPLFLRESVMRTSSSSGQPSSLGLGRERSGTNHAGDLPGPTRLDSSGRCWPSYKDADCL